MTKGAGTNTLAYYETVVNYGRRKFYNVGHLDAAAKWMDVLPDPSLMTGSAPKASRSSTISMELSRIARCRGVWRKGRKNVTKTKNSRHLI